MVDITAAEVFRDFVTDGVPSSGPHNPRKPDIRKLLKQYETIIAAFTSNGGVIYASKAAMDADLARPANTMAWVLGDAVAANNGIYRKVGASGAGNWARAGDLPYSFILASNVGAGTPSAIQATTSIPVSGSALILLQIAEDYAGVAATVSFNGTAPLAIKTNSGEDVRNLAGGSVVYGVISGGVFRLANDEAIASLIYVARDEAVAAADRADAEADRSHDEADRSEAARDIAAGYASDAVSQGNVPIYATKAGMSDITLPVGSVQFQLRGRSVAGDSPLTTWNVVGAVEPDVAPALKGQDAAGVWFVINESRPKIDMFAAWSPQTALGLIQARMAAGEAISIACYGDSTTDGNATTGWTANPVDENNRPVGTTDHEGTAPNAWPAKLKSNLRSMYANDSILVWNAGYSGKQIQNGWAYSNYERAIIDNPAYGVPDICFIAFGLNDIASEGSQIASHVDETRKLCEKVMSYGTIPILVSCDAIGWSALRDNKEARRQIDAAKRAVAAELSIPFIDVAETQKRWLGRNNDRFAWLTEQADLLHFQDNGHAFKAAFLAHKLFPDCVFSREGQALRVPSYDSATSAGYGSLFRTSDRVPARGVAGFHSHR